MAMFQYERIVLLTSFILYFLLLEILHAKKNIQKQVLLVNKRNNEQIISTHFHKKTSVGTFYP